jgi:hypothetical protein
MENKIRDDIIRRARRIGVRRPRLAKAQTGVHRVTALQYLYGQRACLVGTAEALIDALELMEGVADGPSKKHRRNRSGVVIDRGSDRRD